MDCRYPEEKMSKILTIPIDRENLNELIKLNVDGFIIGLKDYSVYTSYDLDIVEIEELSKSIDKELYISINKPLYTDEMDKLKPIIERLSRLNIKGVMFDDIGIINVAKDFNINLIWNQMHHITNSNTINFWTKKNIKGAVLSTELTLDDFINIKKNTNTNIFVYLYGYLPMFESARELLTNYFIHINKEKTDDTYYLYEKERDKYYPIYEKYNNTYILEDLIDAIEEKDNLKDIDYIILNGLLHDNEEFIEIVKSYIGNTNRKSKNKGFLYKETIYKVKNE